MVGYRSTRENVHFVGGAHRLNVLKSGRSVLIPCSSVSICMQTDASYIIEARFEQFANEKIPKSRMETEKRITASGKNSPLSTSNNSFDAPEMLVDQKPRDF